MKRITKFLEISVVTKMQDFREKKNLNQNQNSNQLEIV
jgi:hypothetical protein